MTQEDTSQEESVIIRNMAWGERIIWFIGVGIFFSLAVYSSIERDKQKKIIDDQVWTISDLKFDNQMLNGQVQFYKDMDSISSAFELNFLHKLNELIR